MAELEYEDEDLVHWGLEFEKRMLATDASMDMQRRHGQACIFVVEAILEDVLENLREDVDDDEAMEAPDHAEDQAALPVRDVWRWCLP